MTELPSQHGTRMGLPLRFVQLKPELSLRIAMGMHLIYRCVRLSKSPKCTGMHLMLHMKFAS